MTDKGRGGPRSEAGKAKALANLGDPELAAIKHGFYARPGVLLSCDRCVLREACPRREPGGLCPIERDYVEDRRANLERLEFLDTEGLDAPAITLLIWQEVRLFRAARYLGHAGELLPGAQAGYLEFQPLNKDLGKLISSWQKSLKDLGITPLERRKLEASGEAGPGAEIAKAFAELARREAEEKAEREAATVDGQFEEEGSDDSATEAE